MAPPDRPDSKEPHRSPGSSGAASPFSATGGQASGQPSHGEGGEGHGLLDTKKEFIQTFFKRAEEFTDTLLRENERLRFQILELEDKVRHRALEQPAESSTSSLKELLGRIEALEEERSQMLNRFRSVQRENLDFESRSREIERENNNLANLYVASYQLHSTMDLREVTQTILEILLNFVGAKTFAILLLDEQQGTFRPLAAEGIGRDKVQPIRVGEGLLGSVMSTGKPLMDDSPTREVLDLARPKLASPLKIKEKVVGAIVIWEFLQQKTELADVDFELFNLLAAHAASALQGAKLSLELGGRPPALWGAVDLV